MIRKTCHLIFVSMMLIGGLSASALAQDDSDLASKEKSISAQDDSPQKLQAYAALMQSAGPTGDDGRTLRAMYRKTLFSLYNNESQREQIVGGLQAIIDATPDIDKDEANQEAAQTLVNKHILAQDAQAFAKQGLKISERALEEMKRKMAVARASFLSTLAQADAQAGNTKESLDLFTQVFAVDPYDDAAAAALAKTSEDAGDMQAAIDYLLPDVFSGTASDDVQSMLADAYARTHGNSNAGYGQWLDEAYAKNEEKLVPVTQFSGTLPANPRTVLVELFGSATCGPCVAADIATDAELRRYPPTDALLVVYHENIPQPDPMTSAETDKRGAYYRIDSTPTVYVNGALLDDIGGGSDHATASFSALQDRIDDELSRSTPAKLRLTGSLSANTVSGQANLSGLSQSDGTFMVQVLLVENLVHYVGSNGVRIQSMVVRDFANGGQGFRYKGTDNESYPFTFDLTARDKTLKQYLESVQNQSDTQFKFDHELLPINTNQLSVVAFVQNTKTNEIVQSVMLPISGSAISGSTLVAAADNAQ